MSDGLYNDVEPFVIPWLWNLMDVGLIREGLVDGRPIQELRSEDLNGVTQFHAFAGIGAWSYALRLAGWPDEVPVWTGSCPCQPFSCAGKKRGFKDELHLWPEWFRLIRECRPPVVFGEQVASPDGRAWIDLVSTEMEALGYSFGAADLCAAGIGAPHIRQRLWFVAITSGERLGRIRLQLQQRVERSEMPETPRSCETGALADSESIRLGAGWTSETCHGDSTPRSSERYRHASKLGYSCSPRLERRPGQSRDHEEEFSPSERTDSATSGFWEDCGWIPCQDGKARPIAPGTFPLAHGVAGRVAVVRPRQQTIPTVPGEVHWYSRRGALKAIGNAIVAEVAEIFIRAVIDHLLEPCVGDLL